MAKSFNDTGVGNFLNNTSAGKALDFATDFIPFLGAAKNLGLGVYSLLDDDKENIDWGRLIGGGLGAISPLLARGVGGLLGKQAVKAGTKIAAGAAGKGAELGAKLLRGGATVANYAGKTGIGKTLATGLGTQFGKAQTEATQQDIANQKEAADILNSDLVTGKYMQSLLGELNADTSSEYDNYAAELARKEEQDKANALYSSMNAGNTGLSNLLKGNIANAYNQLSQQAVSEMAKQRAANRLTALNQVDNQFNNLLALAQNTGNNDLLEKLLKAKTSQLSLGV